MPRANKRLISKARGVVISDQEVEGTNLGISRINGRNNERQIPLCDKFPLVLAETATGFGPVAKFGI
jgi:hypothetical protein